MYKRLLAVLLLCILLLCGCSTAKEEVRQENNTTLFDRIQIGFSMDSKVLERWIRDMEVFVSAAEKMGAEVEVQSANGDVDEQIRQIEYFISGQKDVIVIIPTDCQALSDVVKKADEKGIKVISYDRLIEDAPSAAYVTFDGTEIGRLMGETMKEQLPDGGDVIMICGPKRDSNMKTVVKGFQNAIADSSIRIVRKDYAKNWEAEYGYQVVEEAFQGIDRIDGVMCGNDALAVQAVNALAERKLAGSVCVVGQDADVEACQKIMEDLQTMTVYKDIDAQAKKAAEYAVMLAQGLPLPGMKKINTGSYEVEAMLLQPVAVTKENMDEIIIDSGFHMKEDVYMNMEETMGNNITEQAKETAQE